MQEIIDQFSGIICKAAESSHSLQITGGGSKAFYGEPLRGQAKALDVLDVTAYRGIVDYEPTELVITARAGTPLIEIESLLRENGQMLAFEPPHFADTTTLGGCVATGLSGPRRAAAGGVRDFVLGVRMLDGRGNDLQFGGRVMKNVAGYDVSRLMAGSMGTLGVMLEVSLKVLPIPVCEETLSLEVNATNAIEQMNLWAGKPLPVSATCHIDRRLFVRLSGADSAVRAAQQKLGGEAVVDGAHFWQSIREQTHDFFAPEAQFWRLSVKSTSPELPLPGQQLMEWNGALRWLHCPDAAAYDSIRQTANKAGGHATLFRGRIPGVPVFQPLNPALMRIHQRLKQQFDPAGILNPGRLYPAF